MREAQRGRESERITREEDEGGAGERLMYFHS